MHNFVGDNTLSVWWETVLNSIVTLDSESNIAINLIPKGEMIINPGKFQAIILDRKKSNLTNISFTINN